MQKFIATTFVILLTISGCTKSDTKEAAAEAAPAVQQGGGEIGVGPVSSLILEADINADLAKSGSDLFAAKCAACHKFDERYVGPALKGVTQRRKPEWIMNMILNPQEMTQKDSTAQELLGEYMTQMPFQNLDQTQGRAILEYFRNIDKN